MKKDKRVFFAVLHKKSSSKGEVGEKQVNTFLEMPLEKSLSKKDSFPSKAFQQLFLECITALLSSAAVECMFSMGKDVLKPKRTLVLVTSTLKC